MKDNYTFKNPKIKNSCLNCGIDISNLHVQSIRCVGCKEINEKKRKRNYYLKVKDNPEFKLRTKALGKLWRKNNPEKYREQMKINNDKRCKDVVYDVFIKCDTMKY